MIKYLILFLFVLLILSCESPVECNYLEGTLSGSVIVYNQYGNQMDHSGGIFINLNSGRNYGLSDINGEWTIPYLGTGIYNIEFIKSGFQAIPTYGVQFLGGGEIVMDKKKVFQIPTHSVESLNVEIQDEIVAIHMMIQNNFPLNSVIFIDSTINVSRATDNHVFEEFVFLFQNGQHDIKIELSKFFSNGFHSGQECYIIAYAAPRLDIRHFPFWWIDPTTLDFTWVGLNPTPSEIVSIIIP
ncbi:MAG: hypothetical protein HQ510_01420 [Candidatus Marinimicrobia bacterium]|nr:hypothetical protein [Candidatus Neomarinimicrobiota bacterium]